MVLEAMVLGGIVIKGTVIKGIVIKGTVNLTGMNLLMTASYGELTFILRWAVASTHSGSA